MAKFVQGKDGKFAGSIGDGKAAVPTASDVPSPPLTLSDTGAIDAPNYSAMYERMRTRAQIGLVADDDGVYPNKFAVGLPRGDALALLDEGDWVGYQESDPSTGEPVHVWINEHTNAVMTMRNGKLHSVNDEPALVAPDGTRVWYANGKIHRDRGPAVVLANGDSRWFNRGKCTGSGPATGPMVTFVQPTVSRLVRWLLTD